MAHTYTDKAALVSESKLYRYWLSRTWDDTLPLLNIIGLNPSTADSFKDDNTITKEVSFAKSWGYGSLHKTNLFAWRDTHPEKMRAERNPIGFDNDYWIKHIASFCDKTVCAWGNHGGHLQRDVEVQLLLRGYDLHCFGVSKTGKPKHPLYLKGDTRPILWAKAG